MGLTSPLGTEAVNIDQHLKNLADGVDANAAMFSQGVLASRPTSTPGTPGKTGRIYYATDNGKVYYDFGTGWVILNADIPTLGPDSITSTEIAANAVGASELADNSVDAAAIIDGVVGAAEIANALKPSAGAGGSTEALRALGTGAANAAAGNDARLSDKREPLDSWKTLFSQFTDVNPMGSGGSGTWGTLLIPTAGTYVVRLSGQGIVSGQGGSFTLTVSAPVSKAVTGGGFNFEHVSPAWQVVVSAGTTITVTYQNNDTNGPGQLLNGSLQATRIA